MRISIEKYNPQWKDKFESEKQLLLKKLGTSDIDIEHIGSTAIDGLSAKPIIDIMIGLKDFNLADLLIEKLENIEYQYISKYNEIISERRFYIKERNGIRTHHLHMVERGKEFWIRHINFRDYLRNNKADRDEYNRLKIALSKRDWNNRDEYANAKSDFVRLIEKKATATNAQ